MLLPAQLIVDRRLNQWVAISQSGGKELSLCCRYGSHFGFIHVGCSPDHYGHMLD